MQNVIYPCITFGHIGAFNEEFGADALFMLMDAPAEMSDVVVECTS